MSNEPMFTFPKLDKHMNPIHNLYYFHGLYDALVQALLFGRRKQVAADIKIAHDKLPKLERHMNQAYSLS